MAFKIQLIVSLLLFGTVAGFAKLSLGQLKAKLDEINAKAVWEGKNAKQSLREEDATTPDDSRWGWIEFASLVGKCNTYYGWLAITETEGQGSILDDVCPKVLELAKVLRTATEEELANEEWKIQTLFPLVQCTILQAEKEEVAYINLLSSTTENNTYEPAIQPMLENCATVFANIPTILASLDEGLKRVEDDLIQSRRESRLDALLRDLIHASKRK